MQYRWKPGAKLRDKVEQENFQNHEDGEGDRPRNNLLHAAVGTDSLYDEEVHANGRGNQSQFHVNQHDDVEPDEVKAKLFDNGEKHGEGDEDNGHRLQDTAEQ